MQLSLQLSKLQGTTSYFDENVGRVGVKSDTVHYLTSRKIEPKNLFQIGFLLSCTKLGYSKAPIIRTEHWAVLAVHSINCRTGISTGTYNRNFRVCMSKLEQV